MTSAVDWISRLDARHRIVIGLVTAVPIFVFLRAHVRLSTDTIASWDTFSFFVLVSSWITILNTPQQKLRARAQAQDFGRTAIFIFVIVAACAALFAVGFLGIVI